jgi:hypothetical protein
MILWNDQSWLMERDRPNLYTARTMETTRKPDLNAQVDLRTERPRFGRIIEPAVGFIAVALAVATVWSVPRPTGDLYVALAAGRDIVNGKLGKVDDWSFTTNNAQERRVWVNQNWGTHMLYYGFYRLFGGRDGDRAPDTQPGEAGLLLLKFLIIGAGTICLVLALRRRGNGWPVALLVAAGIIAAGRSFIDLRPNLTTLMFVPVMMHVLYWTGEKPHRSWVAMVVFGLIWANLHGGFIFGLVVMAGWAMSMMLPPLASRESLRMFGPGLLGALMAGAMTLSLPALLETFGLGRAGPGAAKLAAAHVVICVLIYLAVALVSRQLRKGGQRQGGWHEAVPTALLFGLSVAALAVVRGRGGEAIVAAVIGAILLCAAFLAGHALAMSMRDLGGKGGLLAVGALAVVAALGGVPTGLAVAVAGVLVWAIVANLLARQKVEPIEPGAVVRRTWPYLAATVGGFILAGVATPFGLQNLGRTDTTLPFGEIWNLTHPLVVGSGPNSGLWQSVIEWHSIFTPSVDNPTAATFGTSWELFTILGIFAGLLPLRMIWKLRARRPLNIADAVLLTVVIGLCIAVVARAWPVYQLMAARPEFKPYEEQRTAWLWAVLAYGALSFLAATVAVMAGAATWRRWKEEGEGVETLSARDVGLLIFEVVWAVFGVLMAFNARRFIPVGLVLCAPLVARELRWLLGDLPKALVDRAPPARAADKLALGARQGVRSPQPAAVAAGADVTSQVLKAMPFTIVAVVVICVVSLQAHQNLLAYLPGNPIQKERSVLKDMIVYRMFPPGPRNFFRANDLGGHVFNEWRWEGYLHWYCPRLSLFVGGRAQQAYSAETYKLQKEILSGEVDAKVLESPEMKIDWIAVPLGQNYDTFLRQVMLSPGAHWVPVYYDGENMVLANGFTPGGAKAVQQCLEGKFRYPNEVDPNSHDPAVAQLSRAHAILSPLTKTPKEQAVAAAKEAIRDRPMFAAYATLGDAYQASPTPMQPEVAYLRSENERLAKMDWRKENGLQVLRSRAWVLETLGNVYASGFEQKRRELAGLEKQVQEALASGKEAAGLRDRADQLRGQLNAITGLFNEVDGQRKEINDSIGVIAERWRR